MPLSVVSTPAAILTDLGKPLVIDEVCLPESLDCGQVLVRVFYSGICGSQLGEIDGRKGPDPYLPHLLGHEGVGEVLQVGPGVRYVNPGDRVVMHWRKGMGIDAEAPVYQWQGQRLNAGFVTTFNNHAVVSENRLTPVDKDLDLRLLPLFGCAVTTGMGAVINNARLKPGESVVVLGAGGVGLNIIQAAAMVNAWPIIAVDRFANRLALAARFGASSCLTNCQDDWQAQLQKMLGPAGADVVIDNTGNPQLIELAYQLSGAKGRVVLVGVPPAGGNISIHSLPLHFGKSISGSHGGETDPAVDIPRYVKLFRLGKLSLSGMITDIYRLKDINQAIADMREGKIAGRGLLDLQAEG